MYNMTTPYVVPHYITSSLDANAVPDEGIYIVTNAITNAPTTNHGVLWNITSVGTPYQMFFPDCQTSIYKRWYTSGAWTAWKLVQVPTDTNAFRNSIALKTFGLRTGNTDSTFDIRNGNSPLYLRKVSCTSSNYTETYNFTPFPNAAWGLFLINPLDSRSSIIYSGARIVSNGSFIYESRQATAGGEVLLIGY